MFYTISNFNDKIVDQVHIYTSLKDFNHEWLPKFEEHCANNHICLSETGAKTELIPLGEDEVTFKALEVKDYALWKVKAFNSKEELKSFLLEQF